MLINHFFIGFLRTRCRLVGEDNSLLICREKYKKICPYLELNDSFLAEAQVHSFRVLHIEGTLVKLRHGVVGVEKGRLLVDFPDDKSG